jgi:predicted DNA-binding transcriptional regulator AlpA
MTELDVLDFPLEHRVIIETEAARYCGLSVVHFRRLRKNEQGPRFVQLGVRRIGYRVGDLLAWLDLRSSGHGGR